MRLARLGAREQARMVFTAIVEYRPAEVDAWLWLSELADNLDDQVSALEKAAQYFSNEGEDGQSLQERLNIIRGGTALAQPESIPESLLKAQQETSAPAARPHPTHSEIYQKAERCFLLGENDKAFKLLASLLEEDPTHADALELFNELLPIPQAASEPVQTDAMQQDVPRKTGLLGALRLLTRRLFVR